MTAAEICELTGLHYCGEDCDCGEASDLFFWPTGGCGAPEPWVPGWMNGVDAHEIERWLSENGKV